MATSNYDVNVQLVLATTAQLEGNLEAAREFREEARRLASARVDRKARVFAFAAAV